MKKYRSETSHKEVSLFYLLFFGIFVSFLFNLKRAFLTEKINHVIMFFLRKGGESVDQSLIFDKNKRKRGSYYRKDFIGDVIYNSFYYREFQINFAKKGRKTTSLTDRFASFLKEKGLISQEEILQYYRHISSLFSLETIPDFDDFSIEELYAFLVNERNEFFGKEKAEKARLLAARESTPLVFRDCLDDRERIKKALREKSTVFIALTEEALFATAKEVLTTLGEGKNVIFFASSRGESGLFSKESLACLFGEDIFVLDLEEDRFLASQKESLSDAILLVFGESGLLDCRNLALPSCVFATPRGYFASAVAGQLSLSRPLALYIPEDFSIVEFVPVTSPTRLNYLILSKLARRFGDAVYRSSVSELYGRYPEYFFNVYESSPKDLSGDVIPSFSPAKQERRAPEELDLIRERAIAEHLESFPNCKYYARVFDSEDHKDIQGKILVHGVKVKKCDEARVIPCGKDFPLREKMRQELKKGTAVSSNFLFFLTSKLATLYNDLRFDRPEEQAQVDAGHLDYLLEYRGSIRKETFPLFRKTCIAMKENGEFLFFNFRLGGGKISFGKVDFSWKKEDVDPSPEKALPPVCIYTPYLSLPDGDADRESYRKTVGEGRFNLVLIQDRITAVRCGDVILPGMGVVLSLSEELGKAFCEALHLAPLQNGYFSHENISFDVTLSPPEGIEKSQWERVKWAYGGGLSLILDGVGLCDGDHTEEWFKRDGWTSPLSRQTQESTLHSLVKHPRTAVGITRKGELVILVFSGRTARSDGADYREMCIIARKLIPDIKDLMNVDGGGSASLGMVYNGSFTELSLPSTSTGSTVGMVRPINTALFVPLK